MPASPPARALSVIATRLRAAGCVFAEDEARLLISAAQTPAELAALVDRRAGGVPLEHVLGWAEFCGLRIAVEPGVFIPRRRTEFLVRQATALARRSAAFTHQPGSANPPAAFTHQPSSANPPAPFTHQPSSANPPADLTGQPPDLIPTGQPPDLAGQPARNHDEACPQPRLVVVDLCCGSGAVGAGLAAALRRAELYAVDIDPAAVRCARRNVAAAGGRVYEGDLYQPLPSILHGRVDILVANAPYVPTEEVGLLPPEARLHEPRIALDGGADGLDILRRVTAEAALWLAPAGYLLVESSERQAPQILESATRNGLISRVATSKELDAAVVIGTIPARQSGQGQPAPPPC